MLTLFVIKLNINIMSHQNDFELFFGSLSLCGKESCQLVKATQGRPGVISRSASTLNLMNHRNHLFLFCILDS